MLLVRKSITAFNGMYFSFLKRCRGFGGPVCIASPAGGVDIEEVASKTPEKIKTVPIDIFEGLSRKTAKDIASFLEFDSASVDQV